MQNISRNIEVDFLGDAEPLQARRNPAESDRRGISFRWFGGSILTGLASVSLMGGALLLGALALRRRRQGKA